MCSSRANTSDSVEEQPEGEIHLDVTNGSSQNVTENSREEYPFETFSGFIAYETQDAHTWVECPLTEMGFFER